MRQEQAVRRAASGGATRVDAIGLAIACVAAVAAALIAWRNRDFVHDDVYIALRYAANLVARGELAWNPGERVEGFTSPLQVALATAAGAAGIDMLAALRVVNVAAAAGLVALTWRFVAALAGPGAALLAAALVVAQPSLIAWVWGGLEAPLFAFLAFAGLVRAHAAARSDATPGAAAGAGALLALACLARPDGAVFLAVGATHVALAAASDRRRRLVAFGLGALALLAPVALARWWYYGALLPNTFHAKVAFDLGHRLLFGGVYLTMFAGAAPLLAPIALAGVVAAGLGSGPARPAVKFLGAAALAYAAAIAWMGGDHMQASRFCVPLLAPLGAIVALSLAGAGPRVSLALRVLIIAALALGAWLEPYRPIDRPAYAGTIVGRHVAATWPPGATVALNTAGSTPYFSPGLRFIDMLGLNDATIARRAVATARVPRQLMPGHAKGDGAYVLARRPDFIIVGPAEGIDARPADDEGAFFLTDLELMESPEFARCYRAERVALAAPPELARQADERRRNPLPFVYFRRVCG